MTTDGHSTTGDDLIVQLPDSPAVTRCRALSEAIFDAVPGDYVVAGGWVRDQFEDPPRAPKDADLWFFSDAGHGAALAHLEAGGHAPGEGRGSGGGLTSKCAHSVVGDLDLLREAPRDDVAGVLLGFDLTCCMGAVDREGRVWAHRDFVDHVANKRLVVVNPKSGVGELRRAIRLAARGYEFWDADARHAIQAWHAAMETKSAAAAAKDYLL